MQSAEMACSSEELLDFRYDNGIYTLERVICVFLLSETLSIWQLAQER